jgi:hypothetical protein
MSVLGGCNHHQVFCAIAPPHTLRSVLLLSVSVQGSSVELLRRRSVMGLWCGDKGGTA